MSENKINKILIIRLSALGDTIHTLPLAYAIKEKYPMVQLDWIVEDKAADFIINNPLIDRVFIIPKRKWKNNKNKISNLKEYSKIIKEIQKEQYDVVIDTQQLLKSAVIMGLSKGKRRIALDSGRELSGIFANEIIKTGLQQFDINFHVVKRNMLIAKYLGCSDDVINFILPDFESELNENLKEIFSDKKKKTIVISPATTWQNKHWANENWSEVINKLKDEYRIIITATENDKKAINEILNIVEINENIINLTGMTTLKDLVYIFKNTDLVITPDSGSCHMAWAVNHPYIISLFFSTSKKRTAPFGNKYYSLQADINCSPCMKKKCHNNEINACNKKIEAKEVINIVKKVLH